MTPVRGTESERLRRALAAHVEPTVHRSARTRCSRQFRLTCSPRGRCAGQGGASWATRSTAGPSSRASSSSGPRSVFDGCGDGRAEETSGATPRTRARFPFSVASGDPRQNTVMLWTRASTPAAAPVTCRSGWRWPPTPASPACVVQKDGLTATAAHDGCIKIRVKGLSPATTYYYRFSFAAGGDPLPLDRRAHPHRSRRHRRRAGPLRGRQLPGLRGAVLEQLPADAHHGTRGPRLLRLHRRLHLRDHRRADASRPRRPAVGDLHQRRRGDRPGRRTNFAAKSVGNYRDLYHTYRSDPLLQQVHERWPVIVTWDDHEYSDDCYGSVATYTNGRHNEQDDQRRRNAEQAFFEYLPVDEGAPGSDPHHRRGGHRPEPALPQPEALAQLRVRQAPRAGDDRPPELPARPPHSRGRLPGDGDADPGDAGRRCSGRRSSTQSFPTNLTEYVNIDDPALRRS